MAIQTGQGIGAAQELRGRVGTPDISAFTNQILKEAQQRRQDNLLEQQRAAKDAADLLKKRNSVASGKTQYFDSLGRQAISKLDEQLKNNEITESEYESRLEGIKNQRDYMEKTAIDMSGKTFGYIAGDEEGVRYGNPTIDILSSTATPEDAEAFLNGELGLNNIIQAGSPLTNRNFLQPTKFNWRKDGYDKYAKELLKPKKSEFNVTEIDENLLGVEAIKKVKVDDVVNLIMSDDEAVDALRFEMVVKDNIPVSEADEIISDEDRFREYIKRKRGVEDIEFVQNIDETIKNKPRTPQNDGGGDVDTFGVVPKEKVVEEVELGDEAFEKQDVEIQGVEVKREGSKTTDQPVTIQDGNSQRQGFIRGVYKVGDSETKVRVEVKKNGKIENFDVPISQITDYLNDNQIRGLEQIATQNKAKLDIDMFIEEVSSPMANVPEIAKKLGNYYPQLTDITDPEGENDLKFTYNGKEYQYDLGEDTEKERFKKDLEMIAGENKNWSEEDPL